MFNMYLVSNQKKSSEAITVDTLADVIQKGKDHFCTNHSIIKESEIKNEFIYKNCEPIALIIHNNREIHTYAIKVVEKS